MSQSYRRSAVLLWAAVVLSGIVGPVVADDPPAQATRRANEPDRTPPGAADGRAADAQPPLAHGVAPRPPAPPLPWEVQQLPEFKALDDITHEKAVGFNDVAKLKRIKEIYQRQIKAEEMIARLLMDRSKMLQEKAEKKVGGGLGPFKFDSIILQRLREMGAGVAQVADQDLAKTSRADSLAHTSEVIRLTRSLSNINAAIVYLTESPPPAP